MVTLLIVGLAVLISVYVTARVHSNRFKRQRGEEDRKRRERFHTKLAWENDLLRGINIESRSTSRVDPSLRSLGNVRYLIWLLNYEPVFRDFSGEPGNQYPPDWEWRREFVFLRDGERCQAVGCTSAVKTGLDCHHIKPISNFAPGESGIHALNNLVTLCATCHATQHPRNLMLNRRAARSVAKNHPLAERSSDRGGGPRIGSFKSAHPIEPPQEVQIFPDCSLIGRHAESAPPISTDLGSTKKLEATSKGIRKGLALVDQRVATATHRENERAKTMDIRHLPTNLRKQSNKAPITTGIKEGLRRIEARIAADASGPDVKACWKDEEKSQFPTYEEYLMKLLAIDSLNELEDFLNKPSWGCLDMQTPEITGSEAEDLWQESEWDNDRGDQHNSLPRTL